MKWLLSILNFLLHHWLKNGLSLAKPWNPSKTTAEDFILSNSRDGSGATLYDLSAASKILLNANPSSTVIFSDATCFAPSSRISK